MKQLIYSLIGASILAGSLAPRAHAATLSPHLKVLLCTGDYGMWAQERVPMIQNAVAKAAPGANVAWEAHQSFNFTSVLENPGYAERFDVVVMGDLGLGQLTPRAQGNLVRFVQGGGGLIYAMADKSTLPFQGAPEAVPMPLAPILPYVYPNFQTPRADATATASTAPLFKGLDFAALTDPGARANLGQLLLERAQGKGRVLTLYGGFTTPLRFVSYGTFEKLPGGWNSWPGLGEMWSRVLQRAAQNSAVRAQSRAALDARVKDVPLSVQIAVDGTRAIDQIRAANFSIVALQQLYNEDGASGETDFLALNPRDWFDRRSQEVLPNGTGIKADKAAFFKDFNIQGIYMADNSYGSYGAWDAGKYAEQVGKAVADRQKWPEQLRFFQAGNEPPLDENYVAFHQKFVGEVLRAAPGYQVVGPNKAFNILGVNPAQMQFYIDRCGATTDVLNWHTYAQPPSTVLAEALYWSGKAEGKMRSPGPVPVMFTESDAWNQGESQFNYLMQRAFTFLPEKRIIANFQYCMRPRSEGGPYRFGVLQPEGEFAANYNGYWVWRNLRGQMTATTLTAPPAAKEHVRAISSRSPNGQSFTTVVYYDAGAFDGAASQKASRVSGTLQAQLPPGNYKLEVSDVAWNKRQTRILAAQKAVPFELAPFGAMAFTWTRQ